MFQFCACVYECVCLHICISIYACVYVSVYLCVCMCMWFHICAFFKGHHSSIKFEVSRNTSTVAPNHIVSDVLPKIICCFGSFNIIHQH